MIVQVFGRWKNKDESKVYLKIDHIEKDKVRIYIRSLEARLH